MKGWSMGHGDRPWDVRTCSRQRRGGACFRPFFRKQHGAPSLPRAHAPSRHLMFFRNHAHISPADRLRGARGARGARRLYQRRYRTLRAACQHRLPAIASSTQQFMLSCKTRTHSLHHVASDILTCQNLKFLAMDLTDPLGWSLHMTGQFAQCRLRLPRCIGLAHKG